MLLEISSSAVWHRRIRLALLALWVTIVGLSLYLFFFQRQVVQEELQGAMSTSLWVAGFVYLLLGSLRGFTLLPVTWLLAVGVLFFPPVPLFILTLIGIVFSSACIYWFAESLRLEEIFNRRHSGLMERLKALLRHRELPIIIGWSFLPFAPTDLICYVCGALRVNFKKCLLGVLLGEGAICAIYVFFAHHLLRYFELKG